MLSRDEYVASMKVKLDEWNTDIDAMEARSEQVKADVKADFQSQLASLRAQRDNGVSKLQELTSASDGAWDRVKLEAENLWDAFKDSATAFREHYK